CITTPITRRPRRVPTRASLPRCSAARTRMRRPAPISSPRTARSPRNPASRRCRSRASCAWAPSRQNTRRPTEPVAANVNQIKTAGACPPSAAFEYQCSYRKSVVQEAPQLPAPARMLQLAQRLRLDLPDALARHAELLAALLQRVVGVHPDSEPHAQHPLLARGERGEHPRGGLAQVRLDRRVDRQHRVLVLDEIAEMRILLV